MSAYELCKPLRNYLRQFPLLDSLGVIRAYLQHLQFDSEIPGDIEVSQQFLSAPSWIDKNIFAWELEILAKEIILNCPERGSKTLKQWHRFSTAVNKLKDLENEISKKYHSLVAENILLELYRIAHRQFPWQQRPNESTLLRYFKVFGHEDLDPILERKLGLPAQQLYTLGLAFTGLFLDTFGLAFPVNFEIPGLTQRQFDSFTRHFSSECSDLKTAIAEAQSYDQDYAYAFNPLKVSPLIWVELRGKRTLIAPVLTYLYRRFTEGVYFEICNEPDFAAAFGRSFQEYVGEVLVAGTQGGQLTILSEQQYHVGGDRKDSIDWILTDNTATIFIECKTKRLRYASKISLESTEELDDDLAKMAGFIVQTYKTLRDAQQGHYMHWQPEDKPLYPVILTLEEWFAFGDRIMPAIDKRVRDGLIENKIDVSAIDEHPYSICGIADFEKAIQIMTEVGINEFMRVKTGKEHKYWPFHSVMIDQFEDEFGLVNGVLFPDDMEKIHPALG